ncbi:hypothetical protein F4703DRAFT_1290399 [Phycomyces blakesleeanus]
MWTDTNTYFSYIVSADNIDEFEEKVERKALVKGHRIISQFIKKICKIMVNVFEKRLLISRSEVVYNTNMNFPCIEAMLDMMRKNKKNPSYFIPGEDELATMTL